MEYNNTPYAIRLGQIIKEHRIEQKLTQAELAWRLQVDERAVRDWEHGRVVSMRIANRMKLHDVLQIPLKILGLPDHFTPEGVLELHKRIRSLLERGSYASVQEDSDALIEGCIALGNDSLSTMPSILARAYYTKGLATATLTNKSRRALRLYEQMERAAAELGDPIGVGIARTYQGDAYRRLDNYDEAQRFLEEVIGQLTGGRRPSEMNALVIGNCHQLLARVHLAKGEREKTLDALKRAEELAHAATPMRAHDWYICFCPCSVKEELAKSLMLLNQYQKGFEAIEEAKRLAQDAPARWAIPITITQGEAIVRYARRADDQLSLKRGLELLSEGYTLAKKHNHVRQQQRISRLTAQWKKNDGFRLASIQEFEEKISRLDREGRDE